MRRGTILTEGQGIGVLVDPVGHFLDNKNVTESFVSG